MMFPTGTRYRIGDELERQIALENAVDYESVAFLSLIVMNSVWMILNLFVKRLKRKSFVPRMKHAK